MGWEIAETSRMEERINKLRINMARNKEIFSLSFIPSYNCLTIKKLYHHPL
ncbi:MAG: hypothetical protein QXV59_07230 [Nitrososphaerota archaeon]